MAQTIKKVSIAFGLVTIPVKLSVAAREESVSFRMLHAECHKPINQDKVCRACDKKLAQADLVKGYENPDGTFTLVTEQELDELAPESSKVMEITSTVDLADVDPLVMGSSYWIEPEPAGRKGYLILWKALRKEKKAAVAKVTLYGREHVIVIRATEEGMAFHTMFYADEIRQCPAGDFSDLEVKPAEMTMARDLVKAFAEPFTHAAYKDTYRQDVLSLIENKRSAKVTPIKAKKAAPKPTAPDIMSVLADSIKAKVIKKAEKSA